MKNQLFSLMAMMNGIDPYDDKGEVSVYEMKHYMNEDVAECQTYLYFYMMIPENDEQEQEMLREFQTRFWKLNEDQQIFIVKDYEKIINAQDENLKRKRERND